MLLCYDSYNYSSDYNYIFRVLLILEMFFIVPPPCLAPERGREKNVEKNERRKLFFINKKSEIILGSNFY